MHFISFFVYYHSLGSTSLFWRFVVIRTNPFFRLIRTLHIELENYFRLNYDSSYRGAYSPHPPFGPEWWSLYNSTDEKCHLLDIHDGLVHILFSTSIFGNPLLIDRSTHPYGSNLAAMFESVPDSHDTGCTCYDCIPNYYMWDLP